MEFKCEREALLDALVAASRAIPPRPPTPALGGVKLDVLGDWLSVDATDNDLSIEADTQVQGLEDGVVVAPGRLLTDIVRKMPQGMIRLHTDLDGGLRIESGRAKFTLATFPVEHFPNVERQDTTTIIGVDGLIEAIGQVARCASTDKLRPILQGVRFESTSETFRLVATDSFRLGLKNIPSTLSAGLSDALVPARAFTELARLIEAYKPDEVGVHASSQSVTFVIGPVTITSRTIEGQYPKYEPLIPKNLPYRLLVDRKEMLEALGRVRLVSDNPTLAVRLEITEEDLTFRLATPGIADAEESMAVTYDGEPITIAFNPAYLIDGLDAINDTTVEITLADPLRPVLLRAVGSHDFTYLLMPVKVTPRN